MQENMLDINAIPAPELQSSLTDLGKTMVFNPHGIDKIKTAAVNISFGV